MHFAKLKHLKNYYSNRTYRVTYQFFAKNVKTMSEPLKTDGVGTAPNVAITPPKTEAAVVQTTLPPKTDPFGEISKAFKTIEVLTNTVDTLKTTVSEIISKSNLPNKMKSSLGTFWEACGTYVILVLVLGTGLGFISMDPTKMNWVMFGSLALILTIQILVGAIKTVANNKLTEKEKSIKDLDAQIRANETALTLASKENSELRVNRDMMEKYIRDKFEPTFQTSFIYKK